MISENKKKLGQALNRFDHLFHKFTADTKGQFAVIFALFVMVLVAGAGATIDLVSMGSAKAKLQDLMDSSVLAGIDSSKSEKEQKKIARKIFKRGFKELNSNKFEGYKTRYKFDGDNLVGKVTTDYKTIFAWAVGAKAMSVKVSSTATEGGNSRGPVCIMTMHPTRAHTLEMKDDVTLNAPDCHIYGNSSNEDDVVDLHSTNNYMIGKSVQAIGYGHHYIENVSPPLSHAPELIPDPFLNMLIPNASSTCTATNLKISGKNVPLAPGTYCGGLQADNGATVRLKKGNYIITRGDLVLKDSTLIGKGATIVLKNKAALAFEGSTVTLEAPKTGPYASFAILGDRVHIDQEIDETAIDIHGIVYLPSSEFEWTNTGTPAVTALWTVWIVDGFSWNGEGVINIPFKPELSKIPFPGSLKNLIPSADKSARLVR